MREFDRKSPDNPTLRDRPPRWGSLKGDGHGVAVSPPDRAFQPGSCCPRLRTLRANRSGKSPLSTQAAILYGKRRDLLILVMKAKSASKKMEGIVNTTENSSPGAAKDRGGGASAPAGRRRIRGGRPRTTRAKVGIAAVAAVGATGLALALVAGPAGASAKPAWMMTAGNVQSMSLQDSGSASYFFNTPTAYGAGASLVKTPVQARYATTPVLAYTSQAQFASDIQSNAISYPYKWVMYDPENWTAT